MKLLYNEGTTCNQTKIYVSRTVIFSLKNKLKQIFLAK